MATKDPGGRGTYMDIDKADLNIDHAYQRDNISRQRVEHINKNLFWLAFGVLIVVERDDRSYWVVDGQHRKLAVLRRKDIRAVPCFVFEEDSLPTEALAYIAINTGRGTMRVFDRFKAMLKAQDEHALEVAELVSESGYKIGTACGHKNAIPLRCVDVLLKEIPRKDGVIQTLWPLIVSICTGGNGAAPASSFVRGMCYLERQLVKQGLGSLLDKPNASRLIKATQAGIATKTAQAEAVAGFTGMRASAQGIVMVLNEKRGTKIPYIVSSR